MLICRQMPSFIQPKQNCRPPTLDDLHHHFCFLLTGNFRQLLIGLLFVGCLPRQQDVMEKNLIVQHKIINHFHRIPFGHISYQDQNNKLIRYFIYVQTQRTHISKLLSEYIFDYLSEI
jgi:hypothetical protein